MSSSRVNKRLGHRKSRNGCTRCKARHVKCDELRPCTNCARHNVACSLESARPPSPAMPERAHSEEDVLSPPSTGPSVSSAMAHSHGRSPLPDPIKHSNSPANAARMEPLPAPYSIMQGPPAGSAAATSSILPPIRGYPDSPASSASYYSHSWQQSLKLMHHYSTKVYPTIFTTPAMEDLWKNTVPEKAFSHDFLMHGVLAVSALHYSHTHPAEAREYSLASTHYQNLALQYFTSGLNNVNDDNCESFLILATLTFLTALCSVANPHEWEKPITPRTIAQSFNMLQGTKSIMSFRPDEKWQNSGSPLAPLLRTWSEAWEPAINPPVGSPFYARIEKLSALARDISPSFDVINAQSSCILAVESLRTTHNWTTSPNSREHLKERRIWFWPLTLSSMFIDMISSRHPVALVILAHYAAMARPFESQNWFRTGWSAMVISVVEREIDARWLDWIAYPKKCVEERRMVDEVDEMGSPAVPVVSPRPPVLQ